MCSASSFGQNAVLPDDQDAAAKVRHDPSPDQLQDLLSETVSTMPLHSPLSAPPLRGRDEVRKILGGSELIVDRTKTLAIVLVAGKKDHGPGEHDYPAWQLAWGQLLTEAENVDLKLAWDFPTDKQFDSADLIVFFQKGQWDDRRAEQIDRYLQSGGGLVYLHWAVNGGDRVAEFSERIGLASEGGKIAYRHGPLSLQSHNQQHPIMRNFSVLDLHDESYWRLTGKPEKVTLLYSSEEDGRATPQVWTFEKGKGRIFVSIPGHYSWTFDDPLFRILVLRGFAWSCRQSVDRFNPLVTLGARIQDKVD